MSRDQEMMELIELFVRARNQEFATTFRNPNWLDQTHPDPTEQRVEVIYTDESGNKLAIEHTLLQPFEGEMYERMLLDSVLGPMEKDCSLIVPGFYILVGVPVGELRKVKPHKRDALRPAIEEWIRTITRKLTGASNQSQYYCERTSGLPFAIALQARYDSRYAGTIHVVGTNAERSVPQTLVKAFANKLEKLSKTGAHKKLLLLEKNLRMFTSWDLARAIRSLEDHTPHLKSIDEIWEVDTSERQRQRKLFASRVWPEQVGPDYFLVMENG